MSRFNQGTYDNVLFVLCPITWSKDLHLLEHLVEPHGEYVHQSNSGSTLPQAGMNYYIETRGKDLSNVDVQKMKNVFEYGEYLNNLCTYAFYLSFSSSEGIPNFMRLQGKRP